MWEIVSTGLEFILGHARTNVVSTVKHRLKVQPDKIREFIIDIKIGKLFPQYDSAQRDYVVDLLQELVKTEKWQNRLLAELKWADNKGVIFIGPSGAGKTSLINALYEQKNEKAQKATRKEEAKDITFGKRVFALRDTPGHYPHADKSSYVEYYRSFFSKPAKIFCLVLANGYLESAGQKNLKRWEKTYKGMVDYLRATQEEEDEWINDLSMHCLSMYVENNQLPKFNHIVIVVNKMDLWADSYTAVKRKYTENETLKNLARTIANNKELHFIGVSSGTFGFQGETQAQKLSDNTAEATSIILRAFLQKLLNEPYKIENNYL